MTMLPNPNFKRDDNNDMIPVGLVRAMFALPVAALALVTFATLSGVKPVAIPPEAPVVQEWTISLIGRGAQSVTVLDANGALMADLDHGAFITVIQNGLETMRRRHGIDPALPLQIVQYENGRLVAVDPLTPYRVELTQFGSDNKAVFERLLNLD